VTGTATTVLVWAGVVLIGGIGSVARYLVDRAVARRAARPFPFGTLAVNISGAALLGFLGGLALSKEAALLAGTAFVGAYTTFSTWMLETQRLGEERQMISTLANIVVSVVLGIAAAMLGQWVGEQILDSQAEWSAALEQLRQDRRVTAVHMATGRHQGHDALLAQLAQLRNRGVAGEFRLVARREFVEPFELMVVPRPQFVRRCNILEPDAHPRVVLADSARPDAIHQDALAVVGIDLVIDPRHPDPRPRFIHESER
jgi:fluoride exporter